METKYGDLPNELLSAYKEKLTGRVFKILPMKEENSSTWEVYIESLLHELIGNKELVKELKENAEFLSMLGVLEGLINEEDIKVIRREIFNCLNLIKKI